MSQLLWMVLHKEYQEAGVLAIQDHQNLGHYIVLSIKINNSLEFKEAIKGQMKQAVIFQTTYNLWIQFLHPHHSAELTNFVVQTSVDPVVNQRVARDGASAEDQGCA